ncbi:MAG: short-chain fatty acid transporter [Phycisphaerales bacterium JB040]
MLQRTSSRLGLAISRFFHVTAPDPFVLAVLLTVVAALLALTLGDFPDAPEGDGPQTVLLDAWRADTGLWRFLAFSMQMCLILVTGHALAASRPARAAIDALARLPRSGPAGVLLVGVTAALAGLVNWGLGLIVGALLAREVARSLANRRIAAHYPVLCAAGYLGLLVWHGGLSGSAPLSVTTTEGAAKVLPPSAMQTLADTGIGLDQTLFTPLNLFVSGGLVVLAPLILWMLTPRDPELCRCIDDVADLPVGEASEPRRPIQTVPEWLERTPPMAWLLAVLLLAAFVRYARHDGLAALGLNEINAVMLALGLILHGSLDSYSKAVTEAAGGCAGIIIQFPLYAGIMAILDASGLIAMFAEALARGGEAGVPLFSFLSAAVVNVFVPSGGGQWGIQGPVALEAGYAAGVAPGKMVMAVSYGDQLTNMLQPFWALPLLAITGARARDIVGYTALVMLAAGAWIALGLLLF